MAEENTAPIKDDAAVETTEVVEEVVETTGEEKFAKSGKKSKKHKSAKLARLRPKPSKRLAKSRVAPLQLLVQKSNAVAKNTKLPQN